MQKQAIALVCLLLMAINGQNQVLPNSHWVVAAFAAPSAQEKAAGSKEVSKAPAAPSITIYNGGFGVVREQIPLSLSEGVSHVSFRDATAHIEPDSVILREWSDKPEGGRPLTILEQNYRNDPVSQELLLSLYEGKTIDFLVNGNIFAPSPDRKIIKGKIIRSGYTPHYEAYSQYGQQYAMAQQMMAQGGAGQPIIEVDGQLQFSLPGQPIFPALASDSILKPTLEWLIQSPRASEGSAELSYVTDGMSWHADYNIVAPASGDEIDLVGWITMDNQTGKTFDNARIKLMAGDVNKIQPYGVAGGVMKATRDEVYAAAMAPPVSERSFDEFHLYTLEHPTTLRDRESKQVQFVTGSHVRSKRIYVYNGAFIDPNRYMGWNMENIRNDMGYGTQSNPKVFVMQEFKNSKDNGLGIPLPKGRLRFYRRDDVSGSLEFTGENTIDHTPADELVRVYTGNAFDIVGERKRTNYKQDSNERWMDESFEIHVRNHKKEAVEVRVTEPLYRWSNWTISAKSHPYKKLDAQRIEFAVQVPPGGEQVVTYTVHYSW